MKKTLFISSVMLAAMCSSAFGAVTYSTLLSELVTDDTITIGNTQNSYLTGSNDVIKYDVTSKDLLSWSMDFQTTFTAGSNNYTQTDKGGFISTNGGHDNTIAVYAAKTTTEGVYEYSIVRKAYGSGVAMADSDFLTTAIAGAETMTLSFDYTTKTATLSNGTDKVSVVCTGFSDSATVLRSGRARIWTNSAHNPANIVSVSGKYAAGTAVTLEDGKTVKEYIGDVNTYSSGRVDAMHSDPGAKAYIVDGTAQLWFAATGSDAAAVTIAGDLYLQSTGVTPQDGKNTGALRLDVSSGHTLTLSGNVVLGSDTVIGSHRDGDSAGTVVFSGTVTGDYALTLNPRNGYVNGSPVTFSNDVDVKSLTANVTASFANLETDSITTGGGRSNDKVNVTVDSLTLSGTDKAITLGGVSTLTLGNNSLALDSLAMGAGTELTLNNHNGSLTTTTLTVGGNATLNADLVVAAGGEMHFTTAGTALTMGCNVTIGEENGSAVNVYIESDNVKGISYGQTVAIIDNLSAEDVVTLGNANIYVNGVFRSDFFLMDMTDEAGNRSIVVAPEPATATLSLLALAGLASRRRRH